MTDSKELNTPTPGVVFSSPESVAPYVYKLYKQGVPRKKVEKILKGCNYAFDISHMDTEGIVKIIINDVYSQKAYKGEEKTLPLFQEEVDFISNYLKSKHQTIEESFSKYEKNITNLLYSFLLYSRYDDYESGWINYNRKRIFDLAGMSKIAEKVKNAISNMLVGDGVLSFRVVGTKNPILCYKLNWRVEIDAQPKEEIYLAPDSTSKNFISQIELISQEK